VSRSRLPHSAAVCRGLRRALEEVARGVAEQLRDVDLLGSARAAGSSGSRAPAAPACGDAGRLGEEAGEEIVEHAEPTKPGGHPPLFGQVDLAQVKGLGWPAGVNPLDRPDRGADAADVAHSGHNANLPVRRRARLRWVPALAADKRRAPRNHRTFRFRRVGGSFIPHGSARAGEVSSNRPEKTPRCR
jgi:hypothetical protein